MPLQLVVVALVDKAILPMVQLVVIPHSQQLALLHLVAGMVDMKVNEVVMGDQVAALVMAVATRAEAELLVKEIMAVVGIIVLV
jgi:hypothetical protein